MTQEAHDGQNGQNGQNETAAREPARPRPTEVLSRLERELREIWKPQPGEPVKSRVCAMNLVVACSSPKLVEKYTPIVDEVTRNIPARAILVTIDPEAPSGLDGDATAVCSVNDGATTTCSERLRLTASGALAARAGSAVEALLVPDIPTSLVWLGRVHVEDPVFLQLARESERIVLDTEYTSLTSLLALARWGREKPGRASIADMAWTRVGPWQEMFARFFDEPKLYGHAKKLTSLTIAQASEPGARLGSEGTLVLGWLASRLGWKVQRVGGRSRLLREDGEVVNIKLHAVPRPMGVAPAALAGMTFAAEADGLVATGSIERTLRSGLEGATPDADVLIWKLSVDLPSATEQTVRLSTNRGARVLERTLHRPAIDLTLDESARFSEKIEEEGWICT
ncbi:glucose-6-phosphate dehydrogenase assembly protein OpcA [Pendulispora albinea]|uniref:Glucose-6-phosphate dehydrogenase assembly protein OpcA n=1 Tax=Pendulispora albinea TaxID=2741071 RepID=A0ABZ2MCB6_9BACT